MNTLKNSEYKFVNTLNAFTEVSITVQEKNELRGKKSFRYEIQTCAHVTTLEMQCKLRNSNAQITDSREYPCLLRNNYAHRPRQTNSISQTKR